MSAVVHEKSMRTPLSGCTSAIIELIFLARLIERMKNHNSNSSTQRGDNNLTPHDTLLDVVSRDLFHFANS